MPTGSDVVRDSFGEAVHQAPEETPGETSEESTEEVRSHVAALIMRLAPRRRIDVTVDERAGHEYGESAAPSRLDHRDVGTVVGQTRRIYIEFVDESGKPRPDRPR